MNEDTKNVFDDAQQALHRFHTRVDNIQQGLNQEAESVSFRLEVVGEQTGSISYVLTGEALVGRSGAEHDPKPEIDLSAYTGYQLGISRRHLLLRLRDGAIEAQDLDSRNGTFVNGYRLSPDQPLRLAHHDEIRLGRLVMVLYIE